jgi:hypothetical protein
VNLGRAIAQAVSRQLPTAAAWVRARFKSRGICDGHSGTGAGFLLVLRVPLPNLIPPIAQQSLSASSITRGWYSRRNSGHSTKWTLSHSMKNKGDCVSMLHFVLSYENLGGGGC